MALFKADGKRKLALILPELLIQRSLEPFTTQLLAVWNQQDKLSLDCQCEDLQGNLLTLNLKWVVPEDVGHLNYRNVIVVLPQLIQ